MWKVKSALESNSHPHSPQSLLWVYFFPPTFNQQFETDREFFLNHPSYTVENVTFKQASTSNPSLLISTLHSLGAPT